MPETDTKLNKRPEPENGRGEGGAQHEPAQEPSLTGESSALQEVSWVLGAWKHAFENKDWMGLADLIGLPQYYITGHPEDSAPLARRMVDLTANLDDFEAVRGELYNLKTIENGIRFSFPLKVCWNSREDWEDHELDIVVHIGFQLLRNAWRATHLVMDNAPKASPERKPNAGPPPPSQAAPPPEPAADRPLTNEKISEAATKYFTQPGMAEPGPASVARGRKQLVYFPVVMDVDLIRDLLG